MNFKISPDNVLFISGMNIFKIVETQINMSINTSTVRLV